MITGKSKTTEKTAGLDSGADDYLAKPFPLDELGARVRALLRRSQRINLDSGKLSVADLVLDSQKYRFSKGGQRIELLPKEFQLLEFLMRNSNQVFAPEAIIRKVWPSDTEATAEAVRTTVKRLRKKIDLEGKVLRTVHGVGYVLDQE
jgi:DNA-binding response OmpR family regulator